VKRVLVIGCSGAGKSTLARALAGRLGLPAIHLDRAYWRAGWRATPDGEFDSAVAELVTGEQWVMDGNFARTLEVRLRRADTVIYLDFPRWRCLWRVSKRVLLWHCSSSPSRPDMSDGCAEQWDWEFIEWVWNFRRVHHAATLAALARHVGRVRVVTLRTPGEVKQFLKGVGVESESGPAGAPLNQGALIP
jgi:adenylate kinase family enzyme